MTPPPVIQRWIDIIDDIHDIHGGDSDALDALLADDVVFYSPALFTPQEGRAKAAMYLTAAAKLFSGTDFHYIGQWFADGSAVLEFAATIDGVHVNGVDMIAWNGDGRIESFKVMMRPYKGLQAIMPGMAELLRSP